MYNSNPELKKVRAQATKTGKPVWYATGDGGGFWVEPNKSAPIARLRRKAKVNASGLNIGDTFETLAGDGPYNVIRVKGSYVWIYDGSALRRVALIGIDFATVKKA